MQPHRLRRRLLRGKGRRGCDLLDGGWCGVGRPQTAEGAGRRRVQFGAARAADSFSRAIRDSSDEGSDDEEVGTDAWKEQQEKRRARYRITTTSSELYDVQSVREKREEQERLRVEHERATREKREALEKKWMESGTQTVAGGGASGRSGTKFATKIEEGWNKDYAAKSTGLTAKEWERV